MNEEEAFPGGPHSSELLGRAGRLLTVIAVNHRQRPVIILLALFFVCG
jgi:hypothetical protein